MFNRKTKKLKQEVEQLKATIKALSEDVDADENRANDKPPEFSTATTSATTASTYKKNDATASSSNTEQSADNDEDTVRHRIKPKILVVDDNTLNQEIISEQMDLLGHHIQLADDGNQALASYRREHFDLVFMDLHMPGMSGYETAEAIRHYEQEQEQQPTPIIALTADISPGTQGHCAAAGMNDYLAKPFSVDDIKVILNKWLANITSDSHTAQTDDSKKESYGHHDILDIAIVEQLQMLGRKSGRNTLGNAISRFQISALEQLITMQDAVKNEDHDNIAAVAHSLKSSSGTLGARLVYASASRIEQLARNQLARNDDFVPVSQALESLDGEIVRSIEALREFESRPLSGDNTAVTIVGCGQHILVVDDDMVALDSLQAAMQQLGYEVDSADNGEKALRLLENNDYELVITDLQMPGMDGYTLCNAIRKTYSVEALPILVLTSTADNVHVQDAYEIGISNFIVKPVNYLNLAYTAQFTIQNARNSHELWHNRQLLEAAEETAQVSHWSWEVSNQHLQFSKHLQSYFEQPLENIKTLDDFIAAVDDGNMETAIRTCLENAQESNWEQQIFPSGKLEPRHILHRFRMVSNEDDNPVLIGTVQEISSIRRAEQRIVELAFYDTLTKLNSRSSFNKKLQDLLVNSKRRKEKFALLYLDLDDFKNINDSYGHDVGDKLLVEVADRLRTLLREADLAFRLGGDEFCLLINNIAEDLSAAKVAQRCLDTLAQPVQLAGIEIIPHASIGIAIYPHNGEDSNFLVKAADTAMYEAKKVGKNQYAFYETAMTDAAHHRLTIENDLRMALGNGEFELYYQPKISLLSGTIESVEALIRWDHPEKGLRPPDTFIPDAERMGLIIDIGEWVVQQACEQIKQWQARGIGDITIAVNISPSHFEQPGFASGIAQIVSDAGVSPALIEIEITESTSRDQEVFSVTCQQLRSLGFRIAIDDFGTGYSSLSVLKGAAVDVLKIDREFIRHLPNDSQSSILIGTILGMCKALGLQVVAEGIETEEQLTVLVAMGCHMAQGYYFSKPVPAADIPALTKCSFRRPKTSKTAFL